MGNSRCTLAVNKSEHRKGFIQISFPN